MSDTSTKPQPVSPQTPQPGARAPRWLSLAALAVLVSLGIGTMSVLTGLVSFGGGKSDGRSSSSTTGDDNDSGSSNDNDVDGNDNCIANESERSCNEKNTYGGANTRLKVVPGLEPGTWRLLIRNLEPFTMVELDMTGPNGEALPLGDYASREVRGDGSADTR